MTSGTCISDASPLTPGGTRMTGAAGHPYSPLGEEVVLRERVGGGEDAEVRCRLPLGVGADHVQAAAGAADRDVEQVGRGADPVAGAAARGLVGTEDEDHDVSFLALHLVNGSDVVTDKHVRALGGVLKCGAERVASDRLALADHRTERTEHVDLL